MKKSIKKSTSIIMVVTLVIMSVISSFSVNAVAENKVHVIIENNVFSVDDGAAWDGVLVDQWVNIDNTSTMMSAVVDALDSNGYTQEGAESNYISSINGLSAFDGGFMSGWMGTLNDWFTNEGFGAFTVANNTLESGDEICLVYSLDYGADAGCLWGDDTTTLASLTFSSGTLSNEFTPDTVKYTLTLPSNTTSLKVTPTAYNKNYQVRTYKNEYTPTLDNSDYKRSEQINIVDGDTIIVGVGNSNWPSMNSVTNETVYVINIKVENETLSGDVNGDGTVNISDCTLIQKHLTNLISFSDKLLLIADFNKDGYVTIADATAIQKNIVK